MKNYFSISLVRYLGILLAFFSLSAASTLPHNVGVISPVDGKNALVDTNYVLTFTNRNPNDDSCTLKVFYLDSGGLPKEITNKALRFFIILPDGNYTQITAHNKYARKVRLQRTTSSPTDFTVAHTQAWLLKKNDPKPPPPPSSNRVVSRHLNIDDGHFPTEAEANDTGLFGTGTIKHTGKFLNADTYLDQFLAVKIDRSWDPWDDVNGYYYIIVTYTNKTVLSTLNSTLTINQCFDSTGYKIDGYYSYAPSSTQVLQYTDLSSSNPTNLSLPIQLQNGEVKHIYIKMKRDPSKVAGPWAQYEASVNPLDGVVAGTKYQTGCSTILLKNSPHDPNTKISSKTRCTAKGYGVITYTITFQNEGTGFARDVIVQDQLPTELFPYTVSTLATSDGVNLSSSNNGRDLKYSFLNIDLPGSNQSYPRVFGYGETIGWVKFSCPATCPNIGQDISNDAGIIFIGDDGVPQPIMTTDSTIVVADSTARPDWSLSKPNPCPTCPKYAGCIGIGRCKWCFTRKCKPQKNTTTTKQ